MSAIAPEIAVSTDCVGIEPKIFLSCHRAHIHAKAPSKRTIEHVKTAMVERRCTNPSNELNKDQKSLQSKNAFIRVISADGTSFPGLFSASPDILVIVATMQYDKTYDVRADAALMRTLDESVSSMKNADWRPICDKTLHRIKESN